MNGYCHFEMTELERCFSRELQEYLAPGHCSCDCFQGLTWACLHMIKHSFRENQNERQAELN